MHWLLASVQAQPSSPGLGPGASPPRPGAPRRCSGFGHWVGSGGPGCWEGSVGLRGRVGLSLVPPRCPPGQAGLGHGPSAGGPPSHTSPQSALGACLWARSTALLQGLQPHPTPSQSVSWGLCPLEEANASPLGGCPCWAGGGGSRQRKRRCWGVGRTASNRIQRPLPVPRGWPV